MDAPRLTPARRPWRPPVEVAFVVGVLLLWQALRIPVEGGSAESAANARAVLELEETLRLNVERPIVSFVETPVLESIADWLYSNLHVPVLVGFMLAARLAAPARYPVLRATFALSYLPALAVIALLPLAPPRWLPELGGVAPSDGDLTRGAHALLVNETAAAASQHFSLALMVGAATVWLWPHARLALLALAYPVVVFLVVVGTRQHYVLDCVVGAATLVLALLVARRVQARGPVLERPRATAAVVRTAAGVALILWAVETMSTQPAALTRAGVAIVAGTAALVWTPSRFAAVGRAARATPWAQLSTAGLATLLAYVLLRQAVTPGFTDYWGYIVVQLALTLALLLGLGVAFAPEGGLSWYSHVVVTVNTWADTLGTAGHLYDRHTSYDKVTHFLAGVAIVALVADVLRALDRRGLLAWSLRKRLVVAVAATLLLNVGWETYEYAGDVLFATGRWKGGLDTTYDLVADVAGALVSVLVLTRFRREVFAPLRPEVLTGRRE